MADVFERYTPDARKAVADAEDEARVRGQGHVGTEHLLLALIRNEASASARTLRALGVSFDAVHAQVAPLLTEGRGSPAGQIPLTPTARRSMDFALRESRQLGESRIDTDHLLLGLLDEGESPGPRLLEKAGADLEQVREAIVQRRGPSES